MSLSRPELESRPGLGSCLDSVWTGLGRPGAVVARAVAIDTLLEGLGLDPEGLPEPSGGAPTHHQEHRARLGQAWVPMVGGTSITQALSLLPDENDELERLHGALYLTFDEMGDPAVRKGLTRPQMELVAARTSAHNECFY